MKDKPTEESQEQGELKLSSPPIIRSWSQYIHLQLELCKWTGFGLFSHSASSSRFYPQTIPWRNKLEKAKVYFLFAYILTTGTYFTRTVELNSSSNLFLGGYFTFTCLTFLTAIGDYVFKGSEVIEAWNEFVDFENRNCLGKRRGFRIYFKTRYNLQPFD